MILDRSAIVAVLLAEHGYEPVLARLHAADLVGVGAPTLTESGIVLTARLGAAGKSLLARFVQESRSVVIPCGDEHWRVGVDAFMRFGKGRHPAALNFGDCLTYATAKLAGGPLLCLGNDFAQTDLELAL